MVAGEDEVVEEEEVEGGGDGARPRIWSSGLTRLRAAGCGLDAIAAAAAAKMGSWRLNGRMLDMVGLVMGKRLEAYRKDAKGAEGRGEDFFGVGSKRKGAEVAEGSAEKRSVDSFLPVGALHAVAWACCPCLACECLNFSQWIL